MEGVGQGPSRAKIIERLKAKLGQPEGKGTHRSEGSNKRLQQLIRRKECLSSKGKGCWR